MKEKNKSETKILLSNTFVFGIGTFSSKLIMFFLLPIYTTYMTSSELGIGELVVNSMNLIYPIATLNIQSALLRFTLDISIDKKNVLKNSMIINFAGILVSSIMIYLFNLDSSINSWKMYLCIMLLTYAIRQTFSVFTKALEKTLLFAIENILYTVFLFIFAIILLVYFRRGISGYLEAIILANIVSSIFLFIAAKIYKYCIGKYTDIILLKSMVKFSIPLIINSISWWISNFFDRFILEYFMNSSAVGIYSVSAKIPALISTIAAVFMQAWVLSAINEYERGGNPTFFKSIFEKFSFIMLTWSSIIIFFIKPVMNILVGKDFADSWKYVPFLLLGSVFNSFGNYFGAIYTSAKKNVEVMLSTITGAIINIIINLILIPKLGIQGAALATMISNFVIAFYRMEGSKKYINFEIDYLKLFMGHAIILFEGYAILFLKGGMFLAGILILVLLLVYIKDINSMFRSLKRLSKKNIFNFFN